MAPGARASRFLEHCGYTCLDTRYRRPGGEIDLVVRRGGAVAFVEVKTRAADALDDPLHGLHRRQLARMRRLGRRWLTEHPDLVWTHLRCDLVAVTCPDGAAGASVVHLVGVG